MKGPVLEMYGLCSAEQELCLALHHTVQRQCSDTSKAAAHVGSSRITQGTTRTKHMFGSRALYLQEYVSHSTDLHASVPQPRIDGGAGLHAWGLGG